jgi:type IV pilus assembly protein PilC
MYNFTYRAINDTGRSIKGEMMAENELDLEARLKAIGLDIIDSREIKNKKFNHFLSAYGTA